MPQGQNKQPQEHIYSLKESCQEQLWKTEQMKSDSRAFSDTLHLQEALSHPRFRWLPTKRGPRDKAVIISSPIYRWTMGTQRGVNDLPNPTDWLVDVPELTHYSLSICWAFSLCQAFC